MQPAYDRYRFVMPASTTLRERMVVVRHVRNADLKYYIRIPSLSMLGASMSMSIGR